MSKIKSLFLYTTVSLLLLSLTLTLSAIYQFDPDSSLPASLTFDFRTVVIDPGHGGKDGGAVSLTGAKEKDLNLDVSLILGDILNILGYDVVFTRQSDIELTHSDGGSRKMQDLKGRLEFLMNYADSPFVSIHMNKFPIEKYSGAQIYYTVNNDNALSLAQSIRSCIIDSIQPSNHRVVKPSTSAIYLLHKAKSPAVLIECGFLSNNEEANLLQDDIYKAKIASAIASGINIWYNGYAVNKG